MNNEKKVAPKFQLNTALKSFISSKAQDKDNPFGFFKVYFWWMFGMLDSKFELARFYPDNKLTRKEQKKVRDFYFMQFTSYHNSKIKKEMDWNANFYFGLFAFWFCVCLIIAGIAILGSAAHNIELLEHAHNIKVGTFNASGYYGVGGAFVGIGIVVWIIFFIVSYINKVFYFYGKKPVYSEANIEDVSNANIYRDRNIIE